MKQYLHTHFESSSGLTPQFRSFAKAYVNALKKQLGSEFDIVGFNRGHFYLSGFVKNNNTGKLAYFSTSDVRYFPGGWYNNILVRSAEHEKDYTGGANQRAKFDELKVKFESITK